VSELRCVVLRDVEVRGLRRRLLVGVLVRIVRHRVLRVHVVPELLRAVLLERVVRPG
jgi:hypothetical protein